MKKLGGAAALVDRSAQNSDAVVERGGELVEAASRLVEQARDAVDRATERVDAAAASLDGTKADLDSALEAQVEQANDLAARVEQAVRNSVQAQGDRQREAAELIHKELAQTDDRVRSNAEQLMQAVSSMLEQQKTSLDAAKAEVLAGTREGQRPIATGIGQSAASLESKLRSQGERTLASVQEADTRIAEASRRTTWLLVAVVVLQVALLGTVLLT